MTKAEDIQALASELLRIAKVGFGYDIDNKDRKALREAASVLSRTAAPGEAVERVRAAVRSATIACHDKGYGVAMSANAEEAFVTALLMTVVAHPAPPAPAAGEMGPDRLSEILDAGFEPFLRLEKTANQDEAKAVTVRTDDLKALLSGFTNASVMAIRMGDRLRALASPAPAADAMPGVETIADLICEHIPTFHGHREAASAILALFACRFYQDHGKHWLAGYENGKRDAEEAAIRSGEKADV